MTVLPEIHTTEIESCQKHSAEDKREVECSHRLHYRWSQLEADRCGVNIGSPMRPIPTACRILELDPNCQYDDDDWPRASSECPEEQAKFSKCAGVYKHIEYNTFSKNGCLKLSEIEMYFLSSKITKETAKDYAVVYLGVGTGERFRWLRDEFFTGLTVVAFDPLDGNFNGSKVKVEKAADAWNEDGTNFTIFLRCYDMEKDSAMIHEKYKDKKLLMISDIRGIAFKNGETSGHRFDKDADQQMQWQAIQQLKPVASLTKFAPPDPWQQFYEYAPGVLLKQTYCYYGTREVRLMIEGVPEKMMKYNVWELFEKMQFHHEHLRGQVYSSERRANSTRCLDCSFDCTVLWDTIFSYSQKNRVDPYGVLDKFVKYHVYSPMNDSAEYTWKPPTTKQRWCDVQGFIKAGRLQEAIAALEVEGKADEPGTDWADIIRLQSLRAAQPHVVKQLKRWLHRPATRTDLIKALGSFSDPFTYVGNELDLLTEEDRETIGYLMEPAAKRHCGEARKDTSCVASVWKNKYADLAENQQKAAVALGWTEDSWNANTFHLPRNTPWENLAEDVRKNLAELGESVETWNHWK